jgi:putative (di)nucleoside polyphosphate hydrolase
MGLIGSQVIDSKGYRKNVGIIVMNPAGKLLWCRRFGQDAWQFPQGGIEADENPEQALYRELDEETGIQPSQVQLLGHTREWLSYRIPRQYTRKKRDEICIGQKQMWYLLKMVDGGIRFSANNASPPEFDQWCWVDYWYPVEHVIPFKREVYLKALTELEPLWIRNLATEAG